jgi:hypothetical protein
MDRAKRSLVVAGGILFVVAIVYGALGHSVGFGNAEIGSLVLDLSILAFAASAGLVAASGSIPRSTRIGLGLLAVGLVVFVTSGLIGAAMPYDPLESLPVVILTLISIATTLLGVVVTTVALSLPRARPKEG